MNEAEILFTEILECDRLTLYQNRFACLDKGKLSQVSEVLHRRMKGEPLAYILGKTEFMGLEFKVNRDVLIPRPETEILVETVCKYVVRSSGRPVKHVPILDLGTGSGCIAVSLAYFLRQARLTAADISHEALAVASLNARNHGLDDRIEFIHSDLFSSSELRAMTYDLIISNPPYIARDAIVRLQPEIQYEPRIALDGGPGGLDFFRKIIFQASDYLNEAGLLVLEIGYGQSGPLRAIFKNSKDWELVEIIKDYNHMDRVIVARKARKDG